MSAIDHSCRVSRSIRPSSRPALTVWFGWLNRRRRVLFLLSAVWVINVFDLLYTLIEVFSGWFHEANPVAARLLAVSPEAIIVYKLTLMLGSSAVLLYYSYRRIVELACWLLLVTHLYLAGCWAAYYEERLAAATDPTVETPPIIGLALP